MTIHDNITDLIGGTPLVKLNRLTEGLPGTVVAKLEFYNPANSVKDRIGKAIIDAAEASGELKPGGTIVEGTSGNTGIALALVGAARGYKVILTMPDTMSQERRVVLRAFGAELVLTPGAEGMKGAVNKANEIVESTDNAILASQFANKANPEVHAATTGEEIWADTDGNVDYFVAGIGTGGTITGAGGYLKSRKPSVRVAAVEPAAAALLSGSTVMGEHELQGIGDGLIPAVLDTNVYDEVIAVTDAQAFDACRQLSRYEGILVGASSGAALYAAMELAKRPENEGKHIVALLPDTGERYLSTPLFDE